MNVSCSVASPARLLLAAAGFVFLDALNITNSKHVDISGTFAPGRQDHNNFAQFPGARMPGKFLITLFFPSPEMGSSPRYTSNSAQQSAGD